MDSKSSLYSTCLGRQGLRVLCENKDYGVTVLNYMYAMVYAVTLRLSCFVVLSWLWYDLDLLMSFCN